jgi:hypothetical protein
MSFRKIGQILVVGWGLLTAPCQADQEELLVGVFGEIPSVQTLKLSPEECEIARALLGRAVSQTVSYWSQDGQSVWILETRAKNGKIRAGFLIRNARICRTQILEYSESRGRQVCSERFLDQFAGTSLRADRKLSRDIDGYTGATLSVHAIGNLARTALFMESLRCRR